MSPLPTVNLSTGSRDGDTRHASGDTAQVVESDDPPARRIPIYCFHVPVDRIGLWLSGLQLEILPADYGGGHGCHSNTKYAVSKVSLKFPFLKVDSYRV